MSAHMLSCHSKELSKLYSIISEGHLSMSTLATMSCNFAMDYLGTFYLHPPKISCQWMKLYSRISGGYLFMSTPALVSLDAIFF